MTPAEIVTVSLVATTFVVGLATAYLRLWSAKQFAKIMRVMDRTYVRRDIYNIHYRTTRAILLAFKSALKKVIGQVPIPDPPDIATESAEPE